MPRPTITPKKMGAPGGSQSENPVLNWLRKRKERRSQAEEEASRLITNKIAENENTMIDKLSSIDFFHSRLPKNVLEAKSDSNQSCGDLEYAAQGIIYTLRKNPQTIKMNICALDQKMLTLVLLFKQAVEQGDVQAAYAAKGALVRAVKDIRSRIPQHQPQLAAQFVQVNAQYLDQWITLVALSQVVDRTEQNVKAQRGLLQKAQDKNKEDIEELEKQIHENPDFTIAFKKLTDGTLSQDRTRWDETEWKVHRLMVERRMDQANLELNRLLEEQQDLDLKTKKAQVDVLYSKVASLPIVTDPDLPNKFQEGIDELFKQLAESDAQIDEILKTMDDIEGRIQQISRAPGSLRAQEVAAEQAEKALQEIKAQQNVQSGKNADRAKKMMEEMGILTEEQLAERKEQLEREEQHAVKAMQKQEQMQDDDREMLVN